jgi:hypothetical protein
MREVLNRRIEYRFGDQVRKITVYEAIFQRIADDALKGNTKSAAFLIDRYRAVLLRNPEPIKYHTPEEIDAEIERRGLKPVSQLLARGGERQSEDEQDESSDA